MQCEQEKVLSRIRGAHQVDLYVLVCMYVCMYVCMLM